MTTIVPFVRGGDRTIVRSLQQALEQRGHEVEVFNLPVHPTPQALLPQMVGLRSIDLTGTADRVIAVRTPSYLVRHPNKVVWFIHHRRPSYDLWDSDRDVSSNGGGWEFRRMIFAADELALGESRAVFANSDVMTERLRRYNGLDATTLYPPLPADHGLVPGPFGDYAVVVARLAPHKRPDLAIRAIAASGSPVRLVLAGKAADDHYADEMRALSKALGVADRVEVLDEWVSEERKRDLLAGSLAVLSLPVGEDSYSYAALEAAVAGKPIITVEDSGGVLELVRDGVNGWVCAPEAEALAHALDRYHADRSLARDHGEAQASVLDDLGLDWDHVVEALLA